RGRHLLRKAGIDEDGEVVRLVAEEFEEVDTGLLLLWVGAPTDNLREQRGARTERLHDRLLLALRNLQQTLRLLRLHLVRDAGADETDRAGGHCHDTDEDRAGELAQQRRARQHDQRNRDRGRGGGPRRELGERRGVAG